MFVKTVRTVRLRYAFTQIVMVRSHFHCRNTVSKYWYFSETTQSFQLASHPISDNASNQDTASKQHHSRIEITTKNMIDHMLSEQLYLFYSFHTCHTWDLINIKMFKDDLISILCILYPQWNYFLPYDGFFILNQYRAASFQHKHGALASAPK